MAERYAEQSRPASQVHSQNQRLVHCLVIGLRTAELHDAKNVMVENAVKELRAAVRERLADADSVTVSARNQCLFVDRERVRVTPVDYLNVRYLMRKFEDWSLPGLRFNAGVTKQDVTELLVFLGRMAPEPGARPPWEEGSAIEPEGPLTESSPATRSDDALRTFAAAMDISRGLNEAFLRNERYRQRSLRRVTQTLVDILLEDENALLAMTSIKNFDGYLFNHSANVAVLSAALGQRLGLHKARLGDLCLAALLHDLGKTMTSKEVLDKTEALTEDDWDEIRRHPVHTVEILLEQGYLSPGVLAAMVAGFEHHLNYDLSGYPEVVNKSQITLFGRIIAISDCYDAITTPRSYRETNLTPFDGICFLLANSGTKFDPVLVKLFVELMGVYPPGTTLRLSSGEVCVVSRSPRPGDPLDRPLVRVLRGPRAGLTIDLSRAAEEPEPVVAEVVNPANLGLLPALDMSALTEGEANGGDAPGRHPRLPRTMRMVGGPGEDEPA
jgi:HD-GYP domain-containing protein (c-di-GMP phosphodiesterase class II)